MERRKQLYEYFFMALLARNLTERSGIPSRACEYSNNMIKCHLIQIGGISDHIHILCILSKNISISQLLMEIKSNSSKWIKTKGIKYQNFYWQNGYGAFSIGYERVDRVSAYIMNQRVHHSKVKFQTEMRTTFKKNKIDFDERYVWD